MAFTVVIALISGAAQAQTLLKPGQGLIGAPQAIEPESPDRPKKADDNEGVTELPQVEVQGKRDALSDADKRLRDQQKKLPGLGTENKRTPGTAEKVIDWYNGLEKDPNKLDAGTQEFIDRVVNSPDDNHKQDYVTVPRRDGSDYVDPIATQEKSQKKP